MGRLTKKPDANGERSVLTFNASLGRWVSSVLVEYPWVGYLIGRVYFSNNNNRENQPWNY